MKHSMIWLSLLFAVTTSAAFADEFLFKNGDRLVGKLKSGADGKIAVDSVSAGSVSVSLADLKTFSTEEPVEIVFKDGTTMKKKILAGVEPGRISIGEGVVNPQSYSILDVDKINPPPVQWTGSLSAGASVTRGNSRTQNANVDLAASRRSDVDRITFGAGYAGSRQEDPTTGTETTTKRMEYGGLQYDYFFAKDFYGYANGRAEKDAIALIDLRFTAGVGAGFQVLDREDLTLSGELGVSWLSENYSNTTPTSDTLAGRAAYHLAKSFNSSVKFFSNGEWYESFEDFEDQFARADVGLRSSLTKSMFAETKVVWSWDSAPATGKERQDVTYLLSVGWSF